MRNSILRLLRPARNQTPEERVLSDARAEVARMRRSFEVREARPPHVRRAWCEDCGAVVELLDETRCACGSRSTAVVARTWVSPRKEARAA